MNKINQNFRNLILSSNLMNLSNFIHFSFQISKRKFFKCKRKFLNLII